jgi:hypothetical protein
MRHCPPDSGSPPFLGEGLGERFHPYQRAPFTWRISTVPSRKKTVVTAKSAV